MNSDLENALRILRRQSVRSVRKTIRKDEYKMIQASGADEYDRYMTQALVRASIEQIMPTAVDRFAVQALPEVGGSSGSVTRELRMVMMSERDFKDLLRYVEYADQDIARMEEFYRGAFDAAPMW